MREYTLITGATGLLGARLTRDLLLSGVPCALIVRPNRFESARQRVESILARFEQNTNVTTLRPVVLEGSLTKDLGLSSESIHWVRRHCARILHNAASLTFERDPKTNEPYRSNVDGARYAVDFALENEIPEFHHISTSYVCGLRDGVCREDELDVGQSWGNDYEKAKVEAEKIVRAANFKEPPTIYRPAIITGDSITGETSTFHGFYTPLKVASALVAERDFRGSSDEIVNFLGMRGDERKNFVPVEWVSRAVVALMRRGDSVGKTFHLTPKNRPTVSEMYDVFTEALREYGEERPKIKKKTSKPTSPEAFEFLLTSFRDQMKVYRSYWRDDPIFDSSNTDAALPDLPCPLMTKDVLKVLAKYALDVNFGWPKPQPVVPNFFLRDVLSVEPTFASAPRTSSSFAVVVSATGPGGGEWNVFLNGGTIDAIEEGTSSNCDARLRLSTRLIAALRSGQVSARDAFDSGAIFWETNNSSLLDASIPTRFTELFVASLRSR